MPEPVSVSSADAMAMLGVSRRTLSRLIAGGRIKARKFSPTMILIDAQSVRDFHDGLPLVGEPAPVKRVRAKRRQS
jgi:hypothetical protein